MFLFIENHPSYMNLKSIWISSYFSESFQEYLIYINTCFYLYLLNIHSYKISVCMFVYTDRHRSYSFHFQILAMCQLK